MCSGARFRIRYVSGAVPVLLVLGYTCLFLENTLYQYIDENGVLHKSFFLPFGCLSLIAGGLDLLMTVIKIVWTCFRQDVAD